MAGFDYGRMAATADRLMGRFAQGTITLTRIVPGEPDPETPWIPGEPTPVDYTLKATARPVEEKFINGSTILSTDTEITAAPFGADPDPSDVMTIDGHAVTIVRVMRIPAAGTVIVWKFVVRG